MSGVGGPRAAAAADPVWQAHVALHAAKHEAASADTGGD